MIFKANLSIKIIYQKWIFWIWRSWSNIYLSSFLIIFPSISIIPAWNKMFNFSAFSSCSSWRDSNSSTFLINLLMTSSFSFNSFSYFNLFCFKSSFSSLSCRLILDVLTRLWKFPLIPIQFHIPYQNLTRGILGIFKKFCKLWLCN